MIHGEPKGETEEDSRNSPPPEESEPYIVVDIPEQVTANLLSVVPKEKPPLYLVGDVHGKIAIIVVSVWTVTW